MPAFLTPIHLVGIVKTCLNVYISFVFTITDLCLMCHAMSLKHRISSINQFLCKHIQTFPLKRAETFENSLKLRTLEELHNTMSVKCEELSCVLGVQVLLGVFVKFLIAVVFSLFLAHLIVHLEKLEDGMN